MTEPTSIVVLKLRSGEIIVGEMFNTFNEFHEMGTVVTILKPHALVAAKQGMILVPFVYPLQALEEINIRLDAIDIAATAASESLENAWREATSGITIARGNLNGEHP